MEMNDLKEKNLSSDIFEAAKLSLPLDMYIDLKKQHQLRLALPTQECSCASVEGVMKSLVNQYDISVLLTRNDAEHKKGKELLITCLFAYSLSEVSSMNRQYDVCIPYEDTGGIDIYIREIDYLGKKIFHRPIQVCEIPEKWIKHNEYPESIEVRVFEFLRDKKLASYGETNHMLLVWLELIEDQSVDVKCIRELFQNYHVIGFSQVVLIGFSKPSSVSVVTAYSRDPRNHFKYIFDYTDFGRPVLYKNQLRNE